MQQRRVKKTLPRRGREGKFNFVRREQRKQAVKRISFHYRGNLLKFITDYRASRVIPLPGGDN